jgi:hypothetical protein
MRAAAFAALIAGTAGSVALMFHAKRHPPPFLVILFIIWVVMPFAALWLGLWLSKKWAARPQAALHVATLFIAVASLLVYADDALNHRTTHPAFVYVAVPPASLLLGALVISIALLKSRRT